MVIIRITIQISLRPVSFLYPAFYFLFSCSNLSLLLPLLICWVILCTKFFPSAFLPRSFSAEFLLGLPSFLFSPPQSAFVFFFIFISIIYQFLPSFFCIFSSIFVSFHSPLVFVPVFPFSTFVRSCTTLFSIP